MEFVERLSRGSVIGGSLLVAGSCIGAGMLALPILIGLAGFFPSLIALFLAWAFMTFTALLLVEINGWFRSPVNILSMAQESLGNKGRLIGGSAYLFLFYALLVAYISASGTIFSAILQQLFAVQIPPWGASLFFTALFGWIIYLGTRPVDLFNRVLMAGLIVAYIGMVGLGAFRIDPSFLLHSAPKFTFFSLPFLVVSFGFQNMVPSLSAYMKGDTRRVKRAIWIGSSLVLAVYVIWAVLVLGVVPVEGPHGILETYQRGEEATAPLCAALGSASFRSFAQAFAFFAVVTSFLAQGLSLTHFISDGLNIPPSRKNTFWLCLAALLPPLGFAFLVPQVFFKALSFAGGVCAMILFGILPIAMAWVGRYRKKIMTTYRTQGGKVALFIGLAFALFVISCEIAYLFSS